MLARRMGARQCAPKRGGCMHHRICRRVASPSSVSDRWVAASPPISTAPVFWEAPGMRSEAAVAAARLSDARASPPPADLAAFPFILFVVPGSREIGEAIRGKHGLLSRPHPGQILVDLTTSNPAETRRLAEAAEAAGRAYVDCGMSGGAFGADAGKLTLMVGGSPDAVARCGPVFERIAAQVFHLGADGSRPYHEARPQPRLPRDLLRHRRGLPPRRAGRARSRRGRRACSTPATRAASSARSAFRSTSSRALSTAARACRTSPRTCTWPRILPRELGQASPYGSLTTALLQQALDDGLAERDFTTLYKHFEQLVRQPSGSPRARQLMTEQRFPLALHTWTLDTTPLDAAIAAARRGGFDAMELRRPISTAASSAGSPTRRCST